MKIYFIHRNNSIYILMGKMEFVLLFLMCVCIYIYVQEAVQMRYYLKGELSRSQNSSAVRIVNVYALHKPYGIKILSVKA